MINDHCIWVSINYCCLCKYQPPYLVIPVILLSCYPLIYQRHPGKIYMPQPWMLFKFILFRLTDKCEVLQGDQIRLWSASIELKNFFVCIKIVLCLNEKIFIYCNIRLVECFINRHYLFNLFSCYYCLFSQQDKLIAQAFKTIAVRVLMIILITPKFL